MLSFMPKRNTQSLIFEVSMVANSQLQQRQATAMAVKIPLGITSAVPCKISIPSDDIMNEDDVTHIDTSLTWMRMTSAMKNFSSTEQGWDPRKEAVMMINPGKFNDLIIDPPAGQCFDRRKLHWETQCHHHARSRWTASSPTVFIQNKHQPPPHLWMDIPCDGRTLLWRTVALRNHC